MIKNEKMMNQMQSNRGYQNNNKRVISIKGIKRIIITRAAVTFQSTGDHPSVRIISSELSEIV